MGVVVGDLASAKVSTLQKGLPWTFGLRSKRPSIMGRSALISLTVVALSLNPRRGALAGISETVQLSGVMRHAERAGPARKAK
jgi:hypothetical protein